ncbi:MAG: ATP synthase subunit I [Gammaproteobacteria bacterium]
MNVENYYYKNRAAVHRMLVVEAGITAVLALLLSLTVESAAAHSSLLGGLTFVLPNALFVRYVFRQSAAVSASTAVRWLYVGEAIKLTTTLLMFAACFIWVKPLSPGVFFGTYIGMVVINMAGNAYLTRS